MNTGSSVISREMVGKSGDTPSRLSGTAIALRASSALAAMQPRDALPGMGYAPTNPVPFPSISLLRLGQSSVVSRLDRLSTTEDEGPGLAH
jgi:hypothetical protein